MRIKIETACRQLVPDPRARPFLWLGSELSSNSTGPSRDLFSRTLACDLFLTLVPACGMLVVMGKYRGFRRKSPTPGANKITSIRHYVLFRDRIILEFRGGELYTYSHEITGEEVVEEMRALAKSGQGLNRYLNSNQPEFEEGYVGPDTEEPGVQGSYG